MVTELVRPIISILQKLFPSSEELSNTGDFVYSFGKASDAILYSLLFMPEFQIVSTSVLLVLSTSDTENERRFLSALSKNDVHLSNLEASFNFVEIGYLFDSSGRDTDDDQDSILADLIAISWRGHLMSEYPDRDFIVEVLPPDVTGSTVGVHFYEER